nr:hypothetical protein Iba_chr04aCG2260 [Ipomoea batatas]GMC85518.1 hypothetical protein Iba_chr04dCG2180 [Ipomoea batatas]
MNKEEQWFYTALYSWAREMTGPRGKSGNLPVFHYSSVFSLGSVAFVNSQLRERKKEEFGL